MMHEELLNAYVNEFQARLPPHFQPWVRHIVAAHLHYDVDPEWLAAILGRESPGDDAEVLGDGGHGHGLGQIDDRYHKSFCSALYEDDNGKFEMWKVPAANIDQAARILRAALDHCEHDYTVAVTAYNAGLGRAKEALRELGADATDAEIIAALDKVTANGNYVSDVLRRKDAIATQGETKL